MNAQLSKQLLAALRQKAMVRPGDRVAVAVSGGADSVALLLLLVRLQPELGIRLSVVHFDHQLRGEDSRADARFVEELANAHGLDFRMDSGDVAAVANREKWNLEDAARRLRYQFFERLVNEGKADKVAVAHTADDQAETVLAHLLRGTGLPGLAGIYPAIGNVIRPLLHVRRQELREFLSECGQVWREDATNQDSLRLRARIRQTLLPLLESSFQPAIAEKLSSLADLSREEEDFWHVFEQGWLRTHATAVDGRVEIPVAALLSSSEESAEGSPRKILGPGEKTIARRIVRLAHEQVRKKRGSLGKSHVDLVLDLLQEGNTGSSVDLPGGVHVTRGYSNLSFLSANRRHHAAPTSLDYAYSIEWPAADEAAISISEIGVRVRLKLIDWPLPASETNELPGVLDAGLLHAPLEVRNWRPGDAYRPDGHRQARKVKELFQRLKIDGWQRPGLPLLTCGGAIIWARGLPVAADFAARSACRRGLLVSEEVL